MARFIVNLNGADLPPGWQGSPSQFMQFIRENWTGEIELNIPEANDALIEVPIGAVLIWPAASVTPPEKFLYCIGDSVLREDYPILFEVIGVTWGDPEDADHFNLPDLRGRAPIGAGTGYAMPEDTTKGRLPEYTVGEYPGFAFPKNRGTYTNGPTSAGLNARKFDLGALAPATKIIGTVVPPSAGVNFVIRAL